MEQLPPGVRPLPDLPDRLLPDSYSYAMIRQGLEYCPNRLSLLAFSPAPHVDHIRDKFHEHLRGPWKSQRSLFCFSLASLSRRGSGAPRGWAHP